jgi:hypothetical protein
MLNAEFHSSTPLALLGQHVGQLERLVKGFFRREGRPERGAANGRLAGPVAQVPFGRRAQKLLPRQVVGRAGRDGNRDFFIDKPSPPRKRRRRGAVLFEKRETAQYRLHAQGLVGTHEQVELRNHFRLPPEFARDDHLETGSFERVEQYLAEGRGHVHAQFGGVLFEKKQVRPNRFLRFFAEALQLGHLARFAGQEQLMRVFEAEVEPDLPDFLRADAFDAKHLKNALGRFAEQVLQLRRGTRRPDFLDARRDALAHAR